MIKSSELGVKPKSCQREGQPCKTENEFSHDRLTVIHRESDDLGKSKMAVFCVFKKTIGRTSEQYFSVHKYCLQILHFCDSDVEDLTFFDFTERSHLGTTTSISS